MSKIRIVLWMIAGFVLFLIPFETASAANPNYDRLVPISKKYVGVPYKWGGTTVRGFDCSGYLVTVYKEIGVSLPRTSGSMYGKGTSVSKSSLQVGDLVFFNTSGKGISHVGMYVGNHQFIHSATSNGVAITSLDSSYWKARYVGAKRILAHFGQPGEFRDVTSSHWVYEAANRLGKEHVLVGYANGYLKPNEYIKRGDVAAILSEAFKLKMNNRKQNFVDVATTSWGVGVANALNEEEIMSGDATKRFRLDDHLTRAQMAAILVRAFDLQGTTDTPFTDVPDNHWASSYVQSIVAAGLTTGYDDGTFRPESKVTRGQFIAFLDRAM